MKIAQGKITFSPAIVMKSEAREAIGELAAIALETEARLARLHARLVDLHARCEHQEHMNVRGMIDLESVAKMVADGTHAAELYSAGRHVDTLIAAVRKVRV